MCRYQTWLDCLRMISMSVWNVPVRFPLRYRMRTQSFPKGVLQVVVWTCYFLWWLTLFDIERVSCPKCHSSSGSPYLVDPSSSSSCQFVILGNKGAVDLPCVIFWTLFSLRRRWRRWQLLRRVDRRSADKCIVFVIGFLCLAVLPVSIIGDLFRMDVLVRLPVLVFLLQ